MGKSHMDLYMGFVVLIEESFNRLTFQDCHVLRYGIHWLLIFWEFDQLLCVFNSKNLKHPAV